MTRTQNRIESRTVYADKLRKHRQQMTAAEIAAVEAVIRALAPEHWLVDRHAEQQMNSKGVYLGDVRTALRAGYIVEVNQQGSKVNAVLRHDGDVATVVVISLSHKYVVTTWANGRSDTHKTLDSTQYNWKVNAAELAAQFIRQ